MLSVDVFTLDGPISRAAITPLFTARKSVFYQSVRSEAEHSRPGDAMSLPREEIGSHLLMALIWFRGLDTNLLEELRIVRELRLPHWQFVYA